MSRGIQALRGRTADAGQTLVETALVLPVLLIMLFALIDFGRAFHTWLLVTNSAREGARVGATQGTHAEVEQRILDSMGGLDPAPLTIALTNVQGDRGTPIEVDLVYDFQWATPLGAFLPGGLADIDIGGSASMRLE